MIIAKRAGASVAAVAGLALLLAGCSSTGGGTSSSTAYNETITPIQNTPVASSNLPAIGANGQMMAPNTLSAPGQPGQPGALNAPPALNPSMQQTAAPGTLMAPQPGVTDQFGNPLTVANANTGFVSTDSFGTVPNTPGRDLSSGLSIEKLLGGWTIVSGAQQCKLNLTYTAKTGTSRYRASTPGCAVAGLSVVASWQLAGSQVQLFDEAGDIVASMLLSGNRFIGSLAGGQSISMVG